MTSHACVPVCSVEECFKAAKAKAKGKGKAKAKGKGKAATDEGGTTADGVTGGSAEGETKADGVTKGTDKGAAKAAKAKGKANAHPAGTGRHVTNAYQPNL